MRTPAAIVFSLAAILTVANAHPVEAADATAWFAQVAIGGGYTTVFTLMNTGIDSVSGSLILTDQDGNPMTANLVSSSGEPSGAQNSPGMIFEAIGPQAPVAVRSGGTQFITATGVGTGDTKVGWARVESSGGTIGGVATFQYSPGGVLTTVAGVLASSPTSVATVPVDADAGQGRIVGYALANPGSDSISVKVVAVRTDGSQAGSFGPIDLGPGKQKAAFFNQLNNIFSQFKGSAVLIEASGKPFAVVALVQNGSLLTAIPVVPAKSPGVN